jgi:hypothetical protein
MLKGQFLSAHAGVWAGCGAQKRLGEKGPKESGKNTDTG